MNGILPAKPLHWVGSSRRDVKAMPPEKGGGVLEVVEDHHGNAYRAIYTIRFVRAVYVLHVFQKKSTKGIKTAKHIMDLIRERMSIAEKMYEAWCAKQDAKKED